LVKAYASNIIKKPNIQHPPFNQSAQIQEKSENMQPKVIRNNSLKPYLTPEHCTIAENYSDKDVSIAIATVKPGVTTKAHHLIGIQEIYIITAGEGKVAFSSLEPTIVSAGDVIVIPPGASQKITNTGKADLIFYCVCTPRFVETCYFDDEPQTT
jgi:mannose-6-phosphate isomerase-like protein (cupin superfamily)